MSGLYGDFAAKTTQQGAINVLKSWTPLCSNGSTPLAGRRQLRIFVRGKVGNALGIAYAPKNADGTFTAPTTDIRLVTIYPGGSIWVEPISDSVNVYGYLLDKVGATENSVRVVVTEYR